MFSILWNLTFTVTPFVTTAQRDDWIFVTSVFHVKRSCLEMSRLRQNPPEHLQPAAVETDCDALTALCTCIDFVFGLAQVDAFEARLA